MNRESGYTLFEMGLALTIAGILFGLSLPTASRWLTNEREDETRREMKGLVESSLRFYHDVQMLPPRLSALVRDDMALPGWSGPYHGVDPNLRSSGGGEGLKDAWGNPYVFAVVNPFNATIRSGGPNHRIDADLPDGGDDLLVFFNTHRLARELTQSRLEPINQAISQYNATLLEVNGPLSSTLGDLLTTLTTTGLLPPGSSQVDGWNQPFTVGPTPVQSISSLGSPDPGPVLIPANQDPEEIEEGEDEPGGGRKITICHIPPGNPSNAHNIRIPVAALAAHLAHGDTVGSCPHGF